MTQDQTPTSTYFRPSPETWAEIVEEYRQGATAKVVAAKWLVSPGSVYRHANRLDATKRQVGDAVAREHADGWDKARAAARDAVRRAVGGLFVTRGHPCEDTDEPGRLSRQAMLAAGRAMRQGLWEEARSLAALGETFQKVASQERDRLAHDLESLPLKAVLTARYATPERVEALFHLSDRPGVKDPERETKETYWRYWRNHKSAQDALDATSARRAEHIKVLKARIAELGGEEPAFEYGKHTVVVETLD